MYRNEIKNTVFLVTMKSDDGIYMMLIWMTYMFMM